MSDAKASRRWLVAAGPLAGLAASVALSSLASIEIPGHASAMPALVVISLALWMAIWWISEAVPIAATALLPVTILPLVGAIDLKTAAAPYAHPLIFLFFSGFLISLAIQKWSLHERFAVTILRRAGTAPARLIGAFMGVAAFLSLWLSNTATTIMMLPIVLSVTADLDATEDFSRCLLIAVAYAATIGGMGTLIGTPPNLFVASYFSETLGRDIGFLQWMMIGLPCVMVLLPAVWLYLTRIHFALPPTLAGVIRDIEGRGLVWRDLNAGARRTLVIFFCVVAGWMLRPWLQDMELGGYQPFRALSDTSIALLGALSLFIVPGERRARDALLTWSDTQHVPWGTLILFGGGLSLAAAITRTGADVAIADAIAQFPPMSAPLLLALIIAIVILLTEMTSNIATTATLVPVLAAAAPSIGLETDVVAVAVALAASCAFMLPVATPPNAIVFGSGRLRTSHLARAGTGANLLGLLVVAVVSSLLVPIMLH